MITIYGGLVLYIGTSDDVSIYVAKDLQVSADFISLIGHWFGNIAEILLFITLVELGGGFSLCINGGTPTKGRKLNRLMILAWSFVLFAIFTGSFGLGLSYSVRLAERTNLNSSISSKSTSSAKKMAEDARSISRLVLALSILMFITSLTILGYISRVMHRIKNHPLLRSVGPVPLIPPPTKPNH